MLGSRVAYSIILPAYHETENLAMLLPRLRVVIREMLPSCETIVIDAIQYDDQTHHICQLNGAKYINRSPTNNYGDAIRTGINLARGEYIIFMDADGSHPPEFIPHMISEAPDFDLIVASRYIKDGGSENTLLSICFSKILNKIYQYFLGRIFFDISNGFKLYKKDSLKELTLTSKHFDIIEEIIFKLIKNNPHIKIKEIPFIFNKRLKGKSKRRLIVLTISYFKTLLKLTFLKKPH